MVDAEWSWWKLDLSHTLTYPFDTVRKRMKRKSGRDDDLTKRHKENSFELCRFLNR